MTRWVALAALLLGACGATPETPGPAGSDGVSYEGAWVLVEGHGPDGEIELVAHYDVTLVITAGSAGGTAGCNRYGGDVAIEGSSFKAGEWVITTMGCAAHIMDTEERYMAAVQVADSIRREGDTLTLEGPDMELVFDHVPPPPTASLVDTEWHLVSLLEGRGAEGVASSAAPATLELAGDGRLRGTTGCRDLIGRWVESGATIVTPELGADGDCEPALRDQDGHVVGVLGDGFTVEIDGQALRVWADQGELGLDYRAD